MRKGIASLQPTICGVLDPRHGCRENSNVLTINHGFAFVAAYLFRKNTGGNLHCIGLLLAAAGGKATLKRIGSGEMYLKSRDLLESWLRIRDQEIALV